MFLTRQQDDIVRRIEEKIALRTMIPAENGEGIQVQLPYISRPFLNVLWSPTILISSLLKT